LKKIGEPVPSDIDKRVLDFYNEYPCGGDDVADDRRWDRLPWLETDFAPAKYADQLVLDLGCGIGIDAEKFVRAGATVVGIDFAITPLRLARKRLAPRKGARWHLVRGDVRALPFKDGVFDHAYSDGVVHHVRGYPRALAEVRRCLKDGGTATILVYHRRSLMTGLTLLVRIALRGGLKRVAQRLLTERAQRPTRTGLAEVFDHPLIQYFTRPRLTSDLELAGLQVKWIRGHDWLFPLVRRVAKPATSPFDQAFGRFLVAEVSKPAEGG